MPCPPSWEERQMWRIESDLATVEQTIAAALPQLRESLSLVDEVKPTPIDDLHECMVFARGVVRDGLPAYSGARAEQRWPELEDVAREEAYLQFRADLAARLELCLCVFGTAIARHAQELPILGAIIREIDRHRAHREHERAERIAELEKAGRHGDAERVRAIPSETLLVDRKALHE